MYLLGWDWKVASVGRVGSSPLDVITQLQQNNERWDHNSAFTVQHKNMIWVMKVEICHFGQTNAYLHKICIGFLIFFKLKIKNVRAVNKMFRSKPDQTSFFTTHFT